MNSFHIASSSSSIETAATADVEPEAKNTEAHRSSVPAGKLKRKSWGFGDELPSPLVRQRHRIICMHARGRINTYKELRG